MTSKRAPSDLPDVQRIASELGDFLHDIYPEQYQPGPSELDLHQWLRQQVAAERVQTSTGMIELFADKVPPELAEAFDQHGVTARKEHEITAPWWMEEYYRTRMGEYTIRQNWRPFYGPAASAKARHERYQAEADEKERAGDSRVQKCFE